MSSNLHVLMLPSWYPTSQDSHSGIFFREQAHAIYRSGCKVGIVYPDFCSLRNIACKNMIKNHFQDDFTDDKGIPSFFWRGWNPPNVSVRRALFVYQVNRLTHLYIHKYGVPNLLHAQSALWGGVAANALARELNVPYIITEHASTFLCNRVPVSCIKDVNNVFSAAARVLAVSQCLSEHLKPFNRGAVSDVVPNMTDTDYFVMGERKTDGSFHILAIANLNANKGIDVLLRAFAQAFKHESTVKLAIGGDGPERLALELLTAELGLTEQVSFLGVLDRGQVRNAMWEADLFVVSSYKETFGIVLIEAMATGLPVVATRSGGPEEIVEEGMGWLVNPGDVSELSRAMQTARQNRAQIKSDRIRASVINRFGCETVTEKILHHYRQVMNGKQNVS